MATFAKFSPRSWSQGQKWIASLIGTTTAATGGLLYVLDNSVKAELLLHPPKLPWPHNGPLDSFDHASLRRGYQVYKQVCSACHSLKFIAFRHFVNNIFTEEEAKAEAASYMVQNAEPNADGEQFKRPGTLIDYIPDPFENEVMAKLANNGAEPPDLSYIVYGRENNENYIYHLLTGYHDAPAGIEVGEGQYFNPYMHGGIIAMAPPLTNEIIEYDDGTPATLSQLSKDVTTFLSWCSQPEHDERKRMGLKVLTCLALIIGPMYYITRFRFAVLKTRKFVQTPPKYEK